MTKKMHVDRYFGPLAGKFLTSPDFIVNTAECAKSEGFSAIAFDNYLTLSDKFKRVRGKGMQYIGGRPSYGAIMDELGECKKKRQANLRASAAERSARRVAWGPVFLESETEDAKQQEMFEAVVDSLELSALVAENADLKQQLSELRKSVSIQMDNLQTLRAENLNFKKHLDVAATVFADIREENNTLRRSAAQYHVMADMLSDRIREYNGESYDDKK